MKKDIMSSDGLEISRSWVRSNSPSIVFFTNKIIFDSIFFDDFENVKKSIFELPRPVNAISGGLSIASAHARILVPQTTKQSSDHWELPTRNKHPVTDCPISVSRQSRSNFKSKKCNREIRDISLATTFFV
jgi:hypothetical protein